MLSSFVVDGLCQQALSRPSDVKQIQSCSALIPMVPVLADPLHHQLTVLTGYVCAAVQMPDPNNSEDHTTGS